MGVKTRIACAIISLPFLTAAGCVARLGYNSASTQEGMRQEIFGACQGNNQFSREKHPSGEMQGSLYYAARMLACGAAVGAYFASDLKGP